MSENKLKSIWVTENNVIHHRKPRDVAAVEYVQLTKNDLNVSCENLTNTELLAEAVKVIEFYADENKTTADLYFDGGNTARDFLAKIER